jgi:uncharacterized membrane protein
MLRPRRGEPTGVGRTEAFSDGVFAVAITLLALDLARIHADPPDITLAQALSLEWPTLLAFAASFVFIGVAWTNHHNVFRRVALQTRALNGANLLLLAGVTMVPWVTATLASSLSGTQGGDGGRQEILLYATVTGLGAITWGLLFHILATNPDLLKDPSHADGFKGDRLSALVGISTTIIGALIGYYWNPLVAVALFLALPAFYYLLSDGLERVSASGDEPRVSA